MALARRYSRWDGSQADLVPDPDELFARLAEDVFHGWDFDSALRRLLSQGFRDSQGRHLGGLEELLEQVRQQRQQRLERFNLEGIFADIQERLDRILRHEREVIADRRQHAQGRSQQGIVERLTQARLDQLDRLPPDPGSAIHQLQEYEFLDPRAAQEFSELLAELRQQLVQTHFRELGQALGRLEADDLARMRQLLADLNQMLGRRLEGTDPGYDQFMQKWGRYFPDHPPDLEAFLAQLQRQMGQLAALLESLDPESRAQLEEMMRSALQDPGLAAEMDRLGQLLAQLAPPDQRSSRFGFFGGEELDLPGALDVMGQLQQLEGLERALRQAYSGQELTEELEQELAAALGPEAARSVAGIQQLLRQLERQGNLRRGPEGVELTPKGVRRLGQRALGDIFRNLTADRFGGHSLPTPGSGSEPGESSKPYEWGEPFRLDVERTLMNALRHDEGERPLRLHSADFEVVESQRSVCTSTVLMLDMSRSMPLRGYFYAAKKMAMALDSLIRSQYPRDSLYIVGFSDYAREISADSLAQLSYSEYVYGTNMQHGLMLARRLLSRNRSGNRQIIVVSDGEPTAHMEEGGRAVFYYPPMPETFHKTLLEVRRCTQERIVINTFMLESNQHLVQFVKKLTRLNRGRAFFVSPDRLGDYVLVDYVASRQRRA
ncbi:MAG: vWA domain-containing protein [Candidatus Dormibacteria bacterium]